MDDARDRRLAQQDAPRVELRPRRDARRGDAARGSPTARSCRPWSRAACRWSGGSRSGSSARSRRGTRRACSGCGSSPRRSRWATPSSSSPIRRRRSSAGRNVRGGLPRGGLPDGLLQIVVGGATSARRSSPTRTSTSCRSPGRRRPGGESASWPGRGSRRSRSSSVATTPSCSTTRTWLPRRRPARSHRSSSRARSASPAGRHIVHESVAGEYIDALRDKAQNLRLGDPYREDVQLGPIVNEKQVKRVDDIVRRSVDGGRGS